MLTNTLTLVGHPPVAPTAAPAAKPSAHWPIAILGVAFDAMTIDEALARIDAMIAKRRPHYVVTPNVDFLAQARHDVELRAILREADLVLCDGTPLVWASRLLGNPLPERVAGADLAPRLIARAAQQGHRLFLLGASPAANAEAAARLRAQYPSLALVGHYSPPHAPLPEMDHADIVRRIRAAQPDILLVSFGCPKQEKWIARHYHTLGVPVVIGVGAVIDFLAGHVRRAPRWMQRGGVEWLYRLTQEPRRLFRRYLHDLRFFGGALLAQYWQLRWRASGAVRGWAVWARAEPHELHVQVAGRFDHDAIVHTARLWEHIQADRGDCIFDLGQLQAIDSTGVALLLRLKTQLHAAGRELTLVAPSAAAQRAFAVLQLADSFTIAPPGARRRAA